MQPGAARGRGDHLDGRRGRAGGGLVERRPDRCGDHELVGGRRDGLGVGQQGGGGLGQGVVAVGVQRQQLEHPAVVGPGGPHHVLARHAASGGHGAARVDVPHHREPVLGRGRGERPLQLARGRGLGRCPPDGLHRDGRQRLGVVGHHEVGGAVDAAPRDQLTLELGPRDLARLVTRDVEQHDRRDGRAHRQVHRAARPVGAQAEVVPATGRDQQAALVQQQLPVGPAGQAEVDLGHEPRHLTGDVDDTQASVEHDVQPAAVGLDQVRFVDAGDLHVGVGGALRGGGLRDRGACGLGAVGRHVVDRHAPDGHAHRPAPGVPHRLCLQVLDQRVAGVERLQPRGGRLHPDRVRVRVGRPGQGVGQQARRGQGHDRRTGQGHDAAHGCAPRPGLVGGTP